MGAAGTSKPAVNPGRIGWRRILVAAAFGVPIATLLNEGLRWLALAILEIPDDFRPLHGPSVVGLTLAGTIAATVVLLLTDRWTKDPWDVFQRIAIGALVVSFIPDVGLLASNQPGATGTSVGVLVIMHVVAFAVIMGAFAAAVSPSPEPSAPGNQGRQTL